MTSPIGHGPWHTFKVSRDTRAKGWFRGGVAEWLMATVLKTVNVRAFVGSNPTPSVLTRDLARYLFGKDAGNVKEVALPPGGLIQQVVPNGGGNHRVFAAPVDHLHRTGGWRYPFGVDGLQA